MDGEGLLNEELPNCWECPKCYQEDSSEKAQVRDLYPDLHCKKKGSVTLSRWPYICLCSCMHVVFSHSEILFFMFDIFFLLLFFLFA